ncbi:hypothetical protein [Paraburkholderia diazotrophica]|nr:hypothetical protein [Paraburkholderia diazotrophica]
MGLVLVDGFLSATLLGFFAFVAGMREYVRSLCPSRASAMRLAARALPLCGAALTFFAAAKKVSKESGLTPPMLDLYPRALNVPIVRTAVCWLVFVANVLAKRLTRFMHVWHDEDIERFSAACR